MAFLSRPAISAAHQALWESVMELAETAVARLVSVDVAQGYLEVNADELERLTALGLSYSGKMMALSAAWDRVAAERPSGADALLRQFLREPEETALLALATAPLLERRIARAYRRLGQAGGSLDAGFLLDLASDRPTGRLRLATFLHPDGALRRLRLLCASTRAPVASATRLVVAPCVVGLLRGEPLHASAGVRVFRDSVPAAFAVSVLDALALPRANPGQLTTLVGADRTPRVVARLIAMAEASELWLVSRSATPTTELGWIALLRDAMLAGAIPAVPGAALGDAGVRGAACRAVQRTLYPALVLTDVSIGAPDMTTPEFAEIETTLAEPKVLHASVLGCATRAGGMSARTETILVGLGLLPFGDGAGKASAALGV